MDTLQVQDYVTEYRNKCVELWLVNSYDELEDSLRRLQQNFACVERTLENASDREAVFLLCRADERCSTDIQAANKERGLG